MTRPSKPFTAKATTRASVAASLDPTSESMVTLVGNGPTAKPPKPVPRGYNGGLRLLWQAYNDALEVQRDPLDFAVELADFTLLGITRADIRRLVSQGHAQHLLPVAAKRSKRRHLQPVDTLTFTDSSCFVLTDTGAALARKLRTGRRAPIITGTARVEAVPSRHQPHWDAGARELWLGRTLVKRFRHAAPNQERILCAFQEENWPTHIDDPLSPSGGLDPKRRLHDTVNHLNKHMQAALIRFRANGAGDGVRWESI